MLPPQSNKANTNIGNLPDLEAREQVVVPVSGAGASAINLNSQAIPGAL